MQSVLSRIWTCVAVPISYDDNHYTTGSPLSHIGAQDNHIGAGAWQLVDWSDQASQTIHLAQEGLKWSIASHMGTLTAESRTA